MPSLPPTALLAAALSLAGSAPAWAGDAEVLALDPAGYWPADGRGAEGVLIDASPNANHGVAHHVPVDAERGLLDFTGKYQWLEVPPHPAYQGEAASFGGWVFLRSGVVGSDWPNRQGFLLLGNDPFLARAGVQLCVRRQGLLDVVMDGEADALGTRQWVNKKGRKTVRQSLGEDPLEVGRWHHVLYAFEPDEETLTKPAPADLAVGAATSEGQDANGPWLRVDLAEPAEVNRVRITWADGGAPSAPATLRFSDGSTLPIPAGAGGGAWDAFFTPRVTGWVRVEGGGARRPGVAGVRLHRVDRVVWSEEGAVRNTAVGAGARGTGRLYLDGELIAEEGDLVHRPIAEALRSGGDAAWWHQQAGKPGSLDGSVRGLVWFDRSLDAGEVAALRDATEPDAEPTARGTETLVLGGLELEDEVTLGGRNAALADWPSLEPAERRELLDAALRRAEPTAEGERAWLPLLSDAVEHPRTRRPAAALLATLGDSPLAGRVTDRALPRLRAALSDGALSPADRAEAALALAALGPAASAAASDLASALRAVVARDGARFPRVEDFERNALLRALLAVAPDARETRAALADAFAKPLFDTIELGEKASAAVAPALAADDPLRALETLGSLPRAARPRFFTDRATGKGSDYTGTAERDGVTFKVGTGVAWEGGEAVTPGDFEAIVREASAEHPTAAGWRPSGFPHLYRVPITRTDADGNTTRVYLGGEGFVLDGADAKMLGWSIFLDEAGYLHVTGGQHNRPDPDAYLPGTWEALGLPRDRRDPGFPAQMYWVSDEPGGLDFTFVGGGEDPRAIPADYLNYMTFLQDDAGRTFLYGRSLAMGFQCWGMYGYDAASGRWSSVGGDPRGVLSAAEAAHPGWGERLHHTVRGGVDAPPEDVKRLVWSWQPAFYNYCRDGFGARFDATGRMHVHMPISGLDAAGFNRLASVYAWSDDRGATFHRADGSPVRLPLTTNPAPEHEAERAGDLGRRWDLWVSLLEEAGFRPPTPSDLRS